MNALSATSVRKNWFDIIRSVIKKHNVFHVNHKDGSVVIISEDDYNGLMETLELLSVPDFKKRFTKSITEMKKGEVLSLDDMKDLLD